MRHERGRSDPGLSDRPGLANQPAVSGARGRVRSSGNVHDALHSIRVPLECGAYFTILIEREWDHVGEKLVASPGELVWKVSELLGIPEPTIVQHDRNLVVAGLRSKSGRGTSAARMTPCDAARLLVAVLGSDQVKNSAQTVGRYSETRIHKPTSEGYQHSAVAGLIRLAPDHSFVDALESLIAAAQDGSLQHAMHHDIEEFRGEKIGFPPIIEVTVQTPQQIADLSIRGARMSGHARYGLPDPWADHQTLHPPAREVEAWRLKTAKYHVDTDLTQYRQITAKTILGVGEVLRT